MGVDAVDCRHKTRPHKTWHFAKAPDVMASLLVTTWLQAISWHVIPIPQRLVKWVTYLFIFFIWWCLNKYMYTNLMSYRYKEQRLVDFTMVFVRVCHRLYAECERSHTSDYLLLLEQLQYSYYGFYIGRCCAHSRQTMAFDADGFGRFGFDFLKFQQ